MRKFMLAGFVVSLLANIAVVRAQDAFEFPKPQQEHEWLAQLVGEWDVESEANFGPDQPPFKCKGTESVRSLGGFWIVAKGESDAMGMEMHSLMTLGYDPQTKKYVGTWVDSSTSHLWKYEGTLDETGKVLTLEAEGPNMLAPGTTTKFRDVIEIKDKDHKVLRASMQQADGQWVQFMTANYSRRK